MVHPVALEQGFNDPSDHRGGGRLRGDGRDELVLAGSTTYWDGRWLRPCAADQPRRGPRQPPGHRCAHRCHPPRKHPYRLDAPRHHRLGQPPRSPSDSAKKHRGCADRDVARGTVTTLEDVPAGTVRVTRSAAAAAVIGLAAGSHRFSWRRCRGRFGTRTAARCAWARTTARWWRRARPAPHVAQRSTVRRLVKRPSPVGTP